MILHGQSDTRVPIPQSEEFLSRPFLSGMFPVEYVVYPRENHGFVEPPPLGRPCAALSGLLWQVFKQCPGYGAQGSG